MSLLLKARAAAEGRVRPKDEQTSFAQCRSWRWTLGGGCGGPWRSPSRDTPGCRGWT